MMKKWLVNAEDTIEAESFEEAVRQFKIFVHSGAIRVFGKEI